MLKRFREEELLGKPLSEKQKSEIARARSARDEDIDTSDIPQTRDSAPERYAGSTCQPFPGPVDAKAVRAGTGLSQVEFAKRYGFNMRTLQDWESSGMQPPSPVRAYLTVIDRFPEMVAKALKGAV